jgi:hypothetical protein
LGLVIAVAVNHAAAFETRYHGTSSGTFIVTGIDEINPGDGFTAALSTFAITTDNLGTVTGQSLREDQIASPPSGMCPVGTIEVTLGMLREVHRFPNGDLLFLNILSRTGCFDLTTLTATNHFAGEFAGGTGRFAHATGSWVGDGTGTIIDPASGFGFFSNEFSGTIITPEPIPHGRKQ